MILTDSHTHRVAVFLCLGMGYWKNTVPKANNHSRVGKDGSRRLKKPPVRISQAVF